ncbi:MAG TPA: hypothetical protein VFS13_01405 [Steroidobacteraceae bacterium]|jgi:hypothetical protein|nr:hypothetical protein [Steroidobacteraceae bacterium]
MNHEISHHISQGDHEFRTAFEAGAIAPADFNHRAHVRLAYIYLATNDVERATYLMRNAIVNFLKHHGIAPMKYHETLTQAWILAVFHFMHRTTSAASADDFIARTPILLDSRIMMTHYSVERLFSQHARQAFVAPDLDPIPRHHAA